MRWPMLSCHLGTAAFVNPAHAESSVFLQAALWAAKLIPTECDVRQSCDWLSLPSAWRYVWNNLRLAPESEELSERLGQIHRLIDHMGEDPGLWYSNWHHGSLVARQLLQEVEALADGSEESGGSEVMRKRFRLEDSGNPARTKTPPGQRHGSGTGVAWVRNLQVERSNRLRLGHLEFPLLGMVLRGTAVGHVYQSTYRALQLGIRSFFLKEMKILELQEAILPAVLGFGLSRHEVVLIGTGDQEMLQHLDGLVATDLQSFQEMQRLEGIGWKVVGFNGMHPERLKEVLENDERKPAFVQNQLTIYEPGGPDDSRNFDSQMEALQKLDIPMVALGLSDENHSCGYLEPLEDPHLLAMAHRRGVSPKQMVDRWWLQLGGLLFVEGHIEEHLGVFDFSLPEDEMRLLNGLSSLVASSPGRRAPVWCEDVYHLSDLPLETG